MKRENKDLLAREQYLLRSTFFYNQLSTQGYFVLFARVKRFVKVEGAHLDWSSRLDWRIGDAAWAAVAALGIPPALAEYPVAVTILVASCITKEMDSRLNASMLLRQRYIMAAITADDREKRKFVNRLRIILDLTRPAL